MSIKLGKREVDIIDVTPAMAKKWLAGNVANRDNRPSWVKSWANAMQRGEWTLTMEPIVFVDEWVHPITGEKFGETLIEGQHRLQAVILSGKTIPFIVWRHSDPKELEAMGQGKPRTQGDILKLTRRGLKHPKTVATTVTAFLKHGLGLHESVDAWMVKRVLDRIEPEMALAVQWKRKLTVLVHRHFMAAFTLAVLINAEKAGAMAHDLKEGVALKYGDPTKILRDYLFDYITDQKRDRPEIYFHKICTGIAAKMRGDQLTRKLEPDPSGLKYLRDKASDKLDPILKDIFGGTPRGFYSPKLPESASAAR